MSDLGGLLDNWSPIDSIADVDIAASVHSQIHQKDELCTQEQHPGSNLSARPWIFAENQGLQHRTRGIRRSDSFRGQRPSGGQDEEGVSLYDLQFGVRHHVRHSILDYLM